MTRAATGSSLVSSLAELEAALAVGGDVVCDSSLTIDVTGAGLTVGLPTRLSGGSFVCTSGPAFMVVSSDVEISGVAIVGAGNGEFDAGQKLIYVLGTKAAPLSNIEVRGCHLTDSASDCLWMEWCVNSRAHHNVIERFANSGIMVISGVGLVVDGNVVSDGVIAAGQVDVYGIAVTDLTNVTADRSRGCSVAYNIVRDIDWEGVDTHGGEALTIVGNTVLACRRSIAVVTGNASRVTAPQQCTVACNTIDAGGARVAADIGIFLAGAEGLPASATVTGNVITGYDGPGQSPIVASNWQRADTVIVGNSRPQVPWTPVALTGGWTPNSSFPPEYMVDGNTVSFRGGAIPPAGGLAGHPAVGSLENAAAWPAKRTFFATTKGSNAAAGTGVLNVDTNGAFRVDYGSTSDSFTYWMTGSYQAV